MTGYCVPCVADTDCSTKGDPSQPVVAPVCIPFVDGGDPSALVPTVTGGGTCGCTDLSQCNGGYTCIDAGIAGRCGPACTYADGVDSCCANGFNWEYGYCPQFDKPYCNTFTGVCQGCLDDYDCTVADSTYCDGVKFCQLDGGYCYGCNSGDDCPAFPSQACTEGMDFYRPFSPVGKFCNTSCSSASQCPSDGGFDCILVDFSYQCLIVCVLGDDAGMGTVSDAGNPCPAYAPHCLTGGSTLDAGLGYCAQCGGDSINPDFTFCDAGNCPKTTGGSALCVYGSCTVTCYL
jgi:hypothetical protein